MSTPPRPRMPFAQKGARLPARQLFRSLREVWILQRQAEGLEYTRSALSAALRGGIPEDRISQWATGNGARASLPVLLRLCALTGRGLHLSPGEIRAEQISEPIPPEEWGEYAAPDLDYERLQRHRIQRAPVYRAVRALWQQAGPGESPRTLASLSRRTGTARNNLSRWASGNQRCNPPFWILILMAWEADRSTLHLHHDRIIITDKTGNTRTTIKAGATP